MQKNSVISEWLILQYIKRQSTLISVGFTTNELTLTWLPSALEFDVEVNVGLPSHYVTNYSLENCTWTDSSG